MSETLKENKLDVKKAYEALAEILGDRVGKKITVSSLEKKTEENTA